MIQELFGQTLSPVGPTQLRELDTSVGVSGPHDFAVRNNISRPRAVDRSQAHHPPCNPVARKTLPRPPHPHPASVTIAIRPLWWGGMREVLEVIWGVRKQKYFCKWDSTQNCPTGKSPRREPIPLVSRTRCSASTRCGHSSAVVKLSGPDVQIYLAAGGMRPMPIGSGRQGS